MNEPQSETPETDAEVEKHMGIPMLDYAVAMENHARTLERQRDAERTQRINLHAKLIDLLHKHGTGETEEYDGEPITEMVERIVAERAAARTELATLRATREHAYGAAIESQRLSWLLDFITRNGGNGIDEIPWTVVDPKKIMEDRLDVVFDRAAVDATMQAVTNSQQKGGDELCAIRDSIADAAKEIVAVRATSDVSKHVQIESILSRLLGAQAGEKSALDETAKHP